MYGKKKIFIKYFKYIFYHNENLKKKINYEVWTKG